MSNKGYLQESENQARREYEQDREKIGALIERGTALIREEQSETEMQP